MEAAGCWKGLAMWGGLPGTGADGDVVDGPGFLPAEEGRFFLDLWSRTSVASRGTKAFQFPSFRVQGGHEEAGGKSRWGRPRVSWWADCLLSLSSPETSFSCPVCSEGVCGLPNHWPLPPSLSPSVGSWGLHPGPLTQRQVGASGQAWASGLGAHVHWRRGPRPPGGA